MKRKKKRFYQNIPAQGIHVISDLNTGKVKIGRIEDLKDEDFYDDCHICQQLKREAEIARTKRLGGHSLRH